MKEANEIDILIPVFNENETIIKTLKNIIIIFYFLKFLNLAMEL